MHGVHHIFFFMHLPPLCTTSAGPKSAKLSTSFENQLVNRKEYFEKLNDLNENCAFWFDEGDQTPSLILRQGDVEVSVDSSGDISGVKKLQCIAGYWLTALCIMILVFFS